MRTSTRHLVDVALADRCPALHRDLDQPDPPPASPTQHDLAIGSPNVRHPVALSQHRHDGPATVEVGQAERERCHLPGCATGHLECHPPPRQHAETEQPTPPPRIPASGVVAATAAVHLAGGVVRDRPACHRHTSTDSPSARHVADRRSRGLAVLVDVRAGGRRGPDQTSEPADAGYAIERDPTLSGPRCQRDAEQALEAVLASVLIRLARREATARAA